MSRPEQFLGSLHAYFREFETRRPSSIESWLRAMLVQLSVTNGLSAMQGDM